MVTEEQRQLLGAFVRARRESIQPHEPGRRRRTPGLRREELAHRAGIGVTWVAWIEQGRDIRPSADTLSLLAYALQLSMAERSYLFELAGRHDPESPSPPNANITPPSVMMMVSALKWPAYGLDPAWNICAANDCARDLFPGLFDEKPNPNLLHYMFMKPEAQLLIPDWKERSARLLAEFRADYGRHINDPHAQSVIEWLSRHSSLFRETWEHHAVQHREGGRREFNHPTKGHIVYEQHTLTAADRSDFKLVVLQPIDE